MALLKALINRPDRTIRRWWTSRQQLEKLKNYLGFPDGISGADLAERARKQACRFGAEILLAREGVRGNLQTAKG